MKARNGGSPVTIKDWLWRNWLPTNDVIIGEGMGGIGKSLFFGDVIARLTTGRPFIDGCPHPTGSPLKTLYITAEDDFSSVVIPRIIAAGGDVNYVTTSSEMSLPDDLGDLETEIDRGDIALTLIDPLFNHISGINPNHDADIREQVMRPLAQIAATTHSTIVVIRHFNKGSGVTITMRGSGSYGGLTGAARGVITAVEEPGDDPGERTERTIIGVTKSNYAKHPKPLVFSVAEVWPARDPILDATLNANNPVPIVWAHDYTLPVILNHGPSDMSIETAQMKLESRRASRATETRQKPAVETLRALLEGKGKVPAIEVYADMREAGFGERATQTARDALGVRYEKDGNSGPWVWWLPDEVPGPHTRAYAPAKPTSEERSSSSSKNAPPPPKNALSITIRAEEREEREERFSMVGGSGGETTPATPWPGRYPGYVFASVGCNDASRSHQKAGAWKRAADSSLTTCTECQRIV